MARASTTVAQLWQPLEEAPAWATEVCPLCSHPLREEMDDRLVTGASRNSIAKEFQVSAGALAKHAAHISTQIARAALARQEVRAEKLLERVLEVDQTAKELAGSADDGKVVISALNTRLRAVDLLGKMTGLISSDTHNTQVNTIVNVSSEELLKMAQDVLSTTGPPTKMLPPDKDERPTHSKRAPTIIDVF